MACRLSIGSEKMGAGGGAFLAGLIILPMRYPKMLF